MRPSGCCMGNVGGEAGGTHFLLFGPGLPNHHLTPSLTPRLLFHAGSSSSAGLSHLHCPPRKSLLLSQLGDSRLAPTAPNFSPRVLQGLTHMGMEAELLIPSNPFFNPAPSLPPPCPGGGSHLEAWAPALCLHHPRLTPPGAWSSCWDHSSSSLLPASSTLDPTVCPPPAAARDASRECPDQALLL